MISSSHPDIRLSQSRFSPDIAGDLILSGGADRTLSRNQTTGFQFDSNYRLSDNHSFRFGATAEMRRTRTQYNTLTFLADDDGEQSSNVPIGISGLFAKTGYVYGFYAQDEWSLRDDLTLNFGARYDRVDAYTKESQLSPRVSLTYHPTDTLDLHVGYARTFTPPEQEDTLRALSLFVGTVRAPVTSDQ